MGLDALVFCDCYAKDRLIKLPPHNIALKVEPDGGLAPKSESELPLEAVLDFDQWLENEACEHPGGILLHHRIGNIAQVARLRGEISRESSRFQFILSKVIHNGVHCGDSIALEVIPKLENELAALEEFTVTDQLPESSPRWLNVVRRRFQKPWERLKFRRDAIDDFRTQLTELVAAAKEVNKPIVF